MIDILTLAWIGWNLNILVIIGILYFLLAIMYKRSSRIIINTAEKPYKPDNTMFKLVFKLSLVIMLWFLAKEYKWDEAISQWWDYTAQFLDWTSDKIGEVWNG